MLPQAPPALQLMGHSCIHHDLFTPEVQAGRFAESMCNCVRRIYCTCHSLPQSKGIGRAPIQVACNQTNLMVSVRKHCQQAMFIQAIANNICASIPARTRKPEKLQQSLQAHMACNKSSYIDHSGSNSPPSAWRAGQQAQSCLGDSHTDSALDHDTNCILSCRGSLC